MSAPTNQPLDVEQLNLFKAYKRKHSEWGNLHIVLADRNIKDGHVASCRAQCVQQNDAEGLVLCNILATMSKSQRIKLSHRY